MIVSRCGGVCVDSHVRCFEDVLLQYVPAVTDFHLYVAGLYAKDGVCVADCGDGFNVTSEGECVLLADQPKG